MKHVGHVTDIHYHRNGVTCNGFWTILFDGVKGSDGEGKFFVATYFEGEMNTAVLELDPLIRGEAHNCLRGDVFHDELKQLAENFDWSRVNERKPRPNRRAAIAHTKAKGESK